MKSKWFAPIPPYLAIWIGLFLFKNSWAALIGFHLAILIVLFILRPHLPLSTFLRNADKRLLIFTLVLCALSGPGLYLLRNVLGISANLRMQLAELGLSGDVWVGFILYFSVVNPIIEEYFWRGALGSDIRTFHSIDFVYAGYHAMVLWNKTSFFSMGLTIFSLTCMGWLWRQIYRLDDSLLTPVLGHAVADLSILLAVFFIVN
ncbi:MAG: CPBP family intramembrane metalloprotease [Chloroflexi bacterium]|nr:MAG: CPBP family intramembrane metalloprotease [Chloroflexota bacterium]